jgi:hypothetical protein
LLFALVRSGRFFEFEFFFVHRDTAELPLHINLKKKKEKKASASLVLCLPAVTQLVQINIIIIQHFGLCLQGQRNFTNRQSKYEPINELYFFDVKNGKVWLNNSGSFQRKDNSPG